MSVIEYVSVFVSIVLGLAVAELGTSFHRLMRARERVRWHWMSLALAFFMLLNILAVWWASYLWYATKLELRMMEFLPDLAILVLTYLAAAAALPDDIPSDGLDLAGSQRLLFSDGTVFLVAQCPSARTGNRDSRPPLHPRIRHNGNCEGAGREYCLIGPRYRSHLRAPALVPRTCNRVYRRINSLGLSDWGVEPSRGLTGVWRLWATTCGKNDSLPPAAPFH